MSTVPTLPAPSAPAAPAAPAAPKRGCVPYVPYPEYSPTVHDFLTLKPFTILPSVFTGFRSVSPSEVNGRQLPVATLPTDTTLSPHDVRNVICKLCLQLAGGGELIDKTLADFVIAASISAQSGAKFVGPTVTVGPTAPVVPVEPTVPVEPVEPTVPVGDIVKSLLEIWLPNHRGKQLVDVFAPDATTPSVNVSRLRWFMGLLPETYRVPLVARDIMEPASSPAPTPISIADAFQLAILDLLVLLKQLDNLDLRGIIVAACNLQPIQKFTDRRLGCSTLSTIAGTFEVTDEDAFEGTRRITYVRDAVLVKNWFTPVGESRQTLASRNEINYRGKCLSYLVAAIARNKSREARGIPIDASELYNVIGWTPFDEDNNWKINGDEVEDAKQIKLIFIILMGLALHLQLPPQEWFQGVDAMTLDTWKIYSKTESESAVHLFRGVLSEALAAVGDFGSARERALDHILCRLFPNASSRAFSVDFIAAYKDAFPARPLLSPYEDASSP